MIRYFNLVWLWICIIVGGIISALSVLLIFAAIGSGLSKGFYYTDFIAIPLLLFPLILTGWSIFLLNQINRSSHFSQKLRFHLLVFYGITSAVSVWASTWTATRDGNTFSMFSPGTPFLVGAFFLVPLLLLIFWPMANKKA